MPSVVFMPFFAFFIALIIASVVVACIYIYMVVKERKDSETEKKSNARYLLPLLIFPVVCCIIFIPLGNFLMSSMYYPTPRFKPAKKDIIGQWHLTEGSKEMIKGDGYEIYDGVIDIKPDGTFIITNYPQHYGFGPTRNWEIYSGSGECKIEKDYNNDWSIRIDFAEKDGVPNDTLTYYSISGKRPPYVIFDYIGDPDSLITIAFIKE